MQKLKWAGVSLGTLLLLSLACFGFLDFRSQVENVHPWEGKIGSESRFRVGVLGDSQKGLANLTRILRAVRRETPAFLLQTGDLVANNDVGHYRLATLCFARQDEYEWPVVVPGNHDIKGGTERFERMIGPLERSFRAGDVVFITINNASGAPPDTKTIESRIASVKPAGAVVLAMHVPPFNAAGEVHPGYEPFLAWLEKSRVKYLLCGHVHGYIKKTVGETTVIINGVGGDYDKWQLDQKVYATILDVDGTKITDRPIEIEPVHEVWENVEHLAIGHVAEAYRRKPVLCWLGTLLLAGAVGWGWCRLLKGSPPQPPQPTRAFDAAPPVRDS